MYRRLVLRTPPAENRVFAWGYRNNWDLKRHSSIVDGQLRQEFLWEQAQTGSHLRLIKEPALAYWFFETQGQLAEATQRSLLHDFHVIEPREAIARLHHPLAHVRARANLVLCLSGGPEVEFYARQAAVAARVDPSPVVRTHAVLGLAYVRDPRFAEKLDHVARTDPDRGVAAIAEQVALALRHLTAATG